MRTLIIHHLESEWESGYKRFGTSLGQLIERFYDHLEEEDYDRVILTRFEHHELGPEHFEIAGWISEVYPYAYGWERDEYTDEEPERWCEGGSHSEVVLIDDWMRELRGEVYISGAFDGECIEDLEIALEHVGVKFNRIEHLIV